MIHVLKDRTPAPTATIDKLVQSYIESSDEMPGSAVLLALATVMARFARFIAPNEETAVKLAQTILLRGFIYDQLDKASMAARTEIAKQADS